MKSLKPKYLIVRSGIDKNTGTHWLRVEQPKDSKVVFKQLEVEGDLIVASDKDNNVYYKIGFNKDLKGKNSLRCSITVNFEFLILLVSI